MDFFLFLLVNAALFIRPGEVVPALQGWPVYNVLIIANLLISASAVMHELSESRLAQCPSTVCVLGVLALSVFSLLVRAEFDNAWNTGMEFAKIVAYFLLLMATVNTPRRLFILLGTIAACTVGVCILAVLHHQGHIDLPGFRQDIDGRMHASGIFGDPNDLSMIIVASILILLAGLLFQQFGILRFLLIAPIGFLGYALTLTQSRGGLLALLGGCGTALCVRFGIVKASIFGAVLFPLVLARFAGRQVDFGSALASGTGRSRVELWSSGLVAMRSSPLWGIGAGHYGDVGGGFVAHNSFIHAFVELGLIGGTLFLGLFAITGWSIWKLRGVRDEIVHPGLRYFLPFSAGLMVAYATSMMSLSRTNDLAVYLIAGSAAIYQRLASRETSVPLPRLDGNAIVALTLVSVGFLAAMHLYIRLFYR